MQPRADFPIAPLLDPLKRSLDAHARLVLEAPPGAGKTTQVPPALLGAAWLGGRRILMLEPRRIAARAAAEFMSAQRGEPVGTTIGYRIRFESRVSAATRIEVVTEGILTRMIQDDPELANVGAILFDEFHERHLHGDLGAALALDVQANLRPDLRLVVMSATLQGARIERWFDAPRLSSEGRGFPVRIAHPPSRSNDTDALALRRAVEEALAGSDGDVLVFLPGKREIESARSMLTSAIVEPQELSRSRENPAAESLSRLRESPVAEPLSRLRERGRGEGNLATTSPSRVEFIALHGELSLQEQHAALTQAPVGTRRVILATNVAESSLTLPGVRAVVDTGLAREPRFDPNSGFTRLETVSISQASADQRAGRAGRLGPGLALRLWPESRRLDADRTPEIAQVELSQLALELAAWGSSQLRWLDAPPPGALAQAHDLLDALGALDRDARIVPFGRRMLDLALHPRLAAMILRAEAGDVGRACDIAALVEARNPLRGIATDDFRMRARALSAWRARDRAAAREAGADAGALAAIAEAGDALRRRLEIKRRDPAFGSRDPRSAPSDAESRTPNPGLSSGNLLLHAYPDRIARQDAANPRRYQLANGRGARLREDSALYGEPWLVVVDLRYDERDSLIQSAAPFDPALLERDFAERFASERIVRWNRETRAVDAFEQRRFDAIVLERRSVPPRAEDAVPALLAAVRELGLGALPWSDHARGLRTRVEALRGWNPDLGLPDFSDAALLASLDEWLAPYLDGKRRLDALAATELSEALFSRLDHAMRAALDKDAPASIRVPSGMERRITYAAGEPPVLAVKLQELFGLADTPRIAGGRVPLTLHLLSPAGRPIQVTQDLRSFWERTYPEVKKELKGRYPKHPWPDDPWTAQATHRAKPRK
ncbi:MAG TPA: ATP-dependent helicase HrpB [Rhodanobacteraceae bacterium]|nr:ATP-dependent helicase HrpB [Rhodanobacteraceae bacterium]